MSSDWLPTASSCPYYARGRPLLAGLVSQAEFRRAIATLGFTASEQEVDKLFRRMDADASGAVGHPR